MPLPVDEIRAALLKAKDRNYPATELEEIIMTGRVSAGTERALKAYKPGMTPSQLTALAVKHGINPSTLYRALVRARLIVQAVRY